MPPRSRSDVSITVYRGADGFRWRMKHLSNGKVVGASTEGYVAEADCRHNLHQVTGWEEDELPDEVA
jgi:uncharacterized protein YegP (UPF0339 family)